MGNKLFGIRSKVYAHFVWLLLVSFFLFVFEKSSTSFFIIGCEDGDRKMIKIGEIKSTKAWI